MHSYEMRRFSLIIYYLAEAQDLNANKESSRVVFLIIHTLQHK